MNCGSCGSGQSCVNNQCLTCSVADCGTRECGTVSNSSGQTVTCGSKNGIWDLGFGCNDAGKCVNVGGGG